jgi:pimeloyl-ACP methyl ester carboxylesterase
MAGFSVNHRWRIAAAAISPRAALGGRGKVSRHMDQPRRLTANGIDFAYLEAGPERGPLALLLHGFPDHAPSWRSLLAALAARGWHAVAPWMRGYHPTGPAPDGRYQSACLAMDAIALVEELAAGEPAALVGHDWGAAAAAGAAISAPQHVRRVVSMALPHAAVFASHLLGDRAQQKRSWYAWFFQMGTLAEICVAADGHAFVEDLWRDWSPGHQPDPEEMRRLRAMFALPGVTEAALEYYRQTFDIRRQADELNALQADISSGRIRVPAMFLMGADDGCVDPAYLSESAAFCDTPPRIEVLDGCGHFLHLERPDEVNRLILDFLGDP